MKESIKWRHDWNWEGLEVREGSTHKGAQVKLVILKRALEDERFALAAIHEGRCTGIRYVGNSKNLYVLENGMKSESTDFEILDKGKGIGSMLTAETLERLAKTDVKTVKTALLRNDKWGGVLIEKLGGRLKKDSVCWEQDEMAKQKWRTCLLKEG